jgi:hypothetical protein
MKQVRLNWIKHKFGMTGRVLAAHRNIATTQRDVELKDREPSAVVELVA